MYTLWGSRPIGPVFGLLSF